MSALKGPITSHILDVARGKPAAGVAVTLARLDAHGVAEESATRRTNDDGRVLDFLPPGPARAGVYRLTFDVKDYFAAQELTTFYPSVVVEFEVAIAKEGAGEGEHYHVPLLLSPFGYSTYRGS